MAPTFDWRECVSCGGLRVQTDLGNGEERPCCLCRREAYSEWVAARQPATRRRARLDSLGRCCGRKPMTYKRPHHYLYCPHCDAAFDPSSGVQQENWAWRADGDAFVASYPTSDYATRLVRGFTREE